MSYRLTHVARQDIRDLTHYIRTVQGSPQNALLVAERLKKQFAKLVESPGLGHVREELNDDEALVIAATGVLVIYDRTVKPLTILRVIHAARDLRGVFSRTR